MNIVGISTLNSYRGSQLFECIGINTQVVDTYFPKTATRIQGVDLHQLEKEISKRYKRAYVKKTIDANLELEMGGQYRWRRNGEHHLFNPLSIAKLQDSVRTNKPHKYLSLIHI